jgi:cytochrome P450
MWGGAHIAGVWPLFGIAHRITSAPITLPGTGEVIPADSVLCFNFEKYQHAHSHFPDPSAFDPTRWEKGPRELDKRTAPYIPFGVASNRPW